MAEINLEQSLSALLATKKKTYQVHTNRISQLDDPCLRRLYYMRHDWDKAKHTDDGLQGIFETGNVLEPVIMRIVSEVGQAADPRWRIVGTQTPTQDFLLAKYQISGTIDGFLQVQQPDSQWTTLGDVDVKTMSGNIFPQVQSYADLSRYAWTRKYRGQLQLYALAHSMERCFILTVNKQNLFQMHLLEFPLDMDYCEGLLQKAKVVNEAIVMGIAPDGVNDPDICPKCPWYAYCAPDMTSGGNLELSDDTELEAILDGLAEIQPAAKEYADLEAERDALLVKGKNVSCGRWLITWKELTVNRKATEARTDTQWRKKIVCAGAKA